MPEHTPATRLRRRPRRNLDRLNRRLSDIAADVEEAIAEAQSLRQHLDVVARSVLDAAATVEAMRRD